MIRVHMRPIDLRMPPWLPNALSFLRVALVPVWVALALAARRAALSGGDPSPTGPILVLVAIGATDIVDGFIARRFGIASNLGATLDAVADKLAQIACVTFLSLAGAPAFTALPLWLMGALAARDLLLAVGWYAVHRRHGQVEAEHRWHGKASSVLLFALIVAALAGAPPLLVRVASAAVLGLVVPSTAAYLVAGWRQLKKPSDR